MPDGRVGLIDFGQVKRITDERRLNFARVVLAVQKDDPVEITKWMNAIGYRTKSNNPYYISGAAKYGFDSQMVTGACSVAYLFQSVFVFSVFYSCYI